MLINQLIDNMLDHAHRHWKDYIIDGHIYIDKSDVLDRAFTRLCGYDMPDALHAEYLQNSDFITATEFMHDIIQNHLLDYERINVRV